MKRRKLLYAFMYPCMKFPQLAETKLKESIFIGPDIRMFRTDESFPCTMIYAEKDAWIAFDLIL